MMYLFVYGTLKRTCSNHHWLGVARYIDEAHTQQCFALYTIGYPFLVKQPSLYPVHGELYQIDEVDLLRVDELERHPDDYCREIITVVGRDGELFQAWAYFHSAPQGVLLADGVFLER
jgi:gamma-glutamylaminecyclotransferase